MWKGAFLVRTAGVGAVVLMVLGGCGADEKINTKVEDKLGHAGVPAAQVHPSTTDRIVRLDGVVASATERDRLERTVRETPGVLGVNNRLVVQTPVTTTGARDGGP